MIKERREELGETYIFFYEMTKVAALISCSMFNISLILIIYFLADVKNEYRVGDIVETIEMTI